MDRSLPDRESARTGSKARLRADQGLTIVEVMVAAMVLVLGALAIFKIVDAATRTSYRAEQSQVVSNLLQRELERVKSLHPSEMVLRANSTPQPADCVTERNSATQEGAGGPADVAPIAPNDPHLVMENDAAVIPCEPVSISPGEGEDSSDVRVDVYRFITWYDPDFGSECEPPPSADENATNVCGMRRITIGAKPVDTGPGGERTYKEIQSDVVDVPGETGG